MYTVKNGGESKNLKKNFFNGIEILFIGKIFVSPLKVIQDKISKVYKKIKTEFIINKLML